MKRRSIALAACVITATSLGSVRSAAAAEGVAVALSFEGCPETLSATVERIARLELHAGQERRDVSTRIAVVCSGDDVALTVDDPLTNKRVDRTVSLSSTAQPARGRLLALAIAELVRSSWIELELNPAPALPAANPVVVSPSQKEEARDVARRAEPSRWRPYGAIEALIVPTVGTPLLGVSLGLQRDLAPSLFLDGAISAWDGATERTSGAVTVRQIALDPTIGLRLSIVDVSLGFRLGFVSLTGEPSGADLRGATTSGVVFGPLLAGSVRIVGPLRLWLRASGLARGARGRVAGDEDVVAGGFEGSIGLGLRFGD